MDVNVLGKLQRRQDCKTMAVVTATIPELLLCVRHSVASLPSDRKSWHWFALTTSKEESRDLRGGNFLTQGLNPSLLHCRQILYHLSHQLLLLLLSRFSHVRLCATPETAAHQVPHPWDSPDKNTGVGCHFLLQCMKVHIS